MAKRLTHYRDQQNPQIGDYFTIATGREYDRQKQVLWCTIVAKAYCDLFGKWLYAVRVKDDIRMLDYVVYPYDLGSREIIACYDATHSKDIYCETDNYLNRLRDIQCITETENLEKRNHEN